MKEKGGTFQSPKLLLEPTEEGVYNTLKSSGVKAKSAPHSILFFLKEHQTTVTIYGVSFGVWCTIYELQTSIELLGAHLNDALKRY